MRTPFEESIGAKLGTRYERLASLQDYSKPEIREAIGILLSYCCTSQHMGNIAAARNALGRVPSSVVIGELLDVARETLDLNDDWQYRRLIETLDIVAPDLLPEALEIGRQSGLSEIREVVEDFEE